MSYKWQEKQAKRDLELFNENLKLNPDLLGSTMTYKQNANYSKHE